jgi:hypothetical protein
MNTRQNYQSLVEKYKGGNQIIRKIGMYGMVMQVCIIMVIKGWNHVVTGYYEIAAPLLFCLSIYFLVKDFITLLKIEKNMALMILEGVDLETQNSTHGKFFHGTLQSFNFTNTLVLRAVVNVVAIHCLGYFIMQFIGEVNPEVAISRWFISLIAWIPGVIACKLYYDSLKCLDEAKEKVFARQST